MTTPRYEAADPYAWPASMRRSLDAAMAKGRLVSTRDALAKGLHQRQHCNEFKPTWPCPAPGNCWLEKVAARDATALLASGVVVDVATLADDEALVERLAFNAAINTIAARSWLRALAAALTEPRP